MGFWPQHHNNYNNDNNNDSNFIITCDYAGYNSFEELTDASDLIVHGIIENDNGISLIDAGAGDMDYNTYDIKVTECLKGEAIEGEIIPLKVLISADKVNVALNEGGEYILFMETYNNGLSASLLNMDQASIGINGNDIIVSDSDKKIIDKSFNRNNLSDDISPASDKSFVVDDIKINKISNFKDKLIKKIKDQK